MLHYCYRVYFYLKSSKSFVKIGCRLQIALVFLSKFPTPLPPSPYLILPNVPPLSSCLGPPPPAPPLFIRDPRVSFFSFTCEQQSS